MMEQDLWAMVRPEEGLGLAARAAAGNTTRTLDTEEALAGVWAGAGASAAAGAGASAEARAGDSPGQRALETAFPKNNHPFVFRNLRQGESFGLNV